MTFSRPVASRCGRLAAIIMIVVLSGCTIIGRSSNDGSAESSDGALILASQTAFADPLSRRGRKRLAEAERQALDFGRAGQPVTWEGRRGRTGSVTAFQPFRVGTATCRRFEHTISTTDGIRTAAATACRRGEEPWKLVR